MKLDLLRAYRALAPVIDLVHEQTVVDPPTEDQAFYARVLDVMDDLWYRMTDAERKVLDQLDRDAMDDVRTPLPTRCPVCGEPQFACPSGTSCPNGHGF